MTPDTFVARLQHARTAKGLSYRALARLGCGCTAVALPDYESGASSPSIDRVVKLAKALEVSAAWLAFGADVALIDGGVEGFGARLRLSRITAGLRQQDLAQAADLTQVSIGEFESEQRLPRLDTAAALAAKLRVRSVWLAFGVGQMTE